MDSKKENDKLAQAHHRRFQALGDDNGKGTARFSFPFIARHTRPFADDASVRRNVFDETTRRRERCCTPPEDWWRRGLDWTTLH